MSQKKIAAKLLILLLISIAPVTGALFIYQMRDNIHFATKNSGQLINPPVELITLSLVDAHNKPVNPTEEGLRWWLVLYTPKVCDIECQGIVAYFDTIHLSLTEHKQRIAELVLTPNDLDMAALPQDIATLRAARVLGTLPSSLPLVNGYGLWLMDPHGNIILSYNPTTLDNRPLLDLKHLLKVSRIG